MMIRILRLLIASPGLLIVLCINGSYLDDTSILSGEQRRGQRDRVELSATLGLDQGLIEFDTPEFTLRLVRASQLSAVHLVSPFIPGPHGLS